ncbi:hypothetical protein Theth_1697 [Pseudothermotoga thermarum DSM 5069]|uniref:Uncharacterized protein n=2 Tax=Pseudothermotoga thermarum TaxID=119394 RepID=F7YVS4_9THEM|nr:hypothetical protein Theth_1697 [Pseudothermotoga thermarum DSM 5069]
MFVETFELKNREFDLEEDEKALDFVCGGLNSGKDIEFNFQTLCHLHFAGVPKDKDRKTLVTVLMKRKSKFGFKSMITKESDLST